MTRPLNPDARYVSDRPCHYCGTYERYKRSGDCCECKKRHQQEAWAIHRSSPQHRATLASSAAENKAARKITDPTIGAAFPAGLARCMAGR